MIISNKQRRISAVVKKYNNTIILRPTSDTLYHCIYRGKGKFGLRPMHKKPKYKYELGCWKFVRNRSVGNISALRIVGKNIKLKWDTNYV